MSTRDDWTTIESDPGVFTELIEGIGVKGVQVEELYALDPSLLEDLKPVYGLIFLFKWDPKQASVKPTIATNAPGVFFANQVINNACATQAILSILLNKDDQIDLGENLTEFKKTVNEFPSDIKGLAIGNNTTIKTVHNSFRRPESISVIEKAATSSDEVYHFIAYVPVNGQIYELDGLQKGPISHGPCTDQDWLDKVSPVIMQRIEKYSESEIRFNLLALIKNRKTAYTELINELETQNARIEAKLSGNAMDVDSGAVGGALPDGADALHTLQAENAARIEDARSKIQDEEAKFKQWREENIRRRHNYIPFLFNLLQVLAQKQQLLPLLDKARQKHEEKKKKEKPSGSK